jgi:hypothetical protein
MAKKKYTIGDVYKNYEKDHLSTDRYSIDKELFKQIAHLLFKKISKEIIENGSEIKLPFRMGKIFIKKFIPSNPQKNINFKLTKQLYGEWNKNNPKDKKVVFNTNKHSSGYSARWYWDKTDCVVTNKSLYRFSTTRANSRATSQAIQFKNTIHKYAS